MRVSAQEVVNLPPQAVFTLFSNLERSREYSKPVIERSKISDGPIGLGTRYRAIDQWPGRRVQFTVEITEFEEPNSLAAEWSEPMKGRWQARLAPEGEGTRLSFEAAMEPGGLMGLLTPVLKLWAQRQTNAFLRDFKGWAENQRD